MCVFQFLYADDKGLRGRNILQLVVDRFCYIFAHNQFTYTEHTPLPEAVRNTLIYASL